MRSKRKASAANGAFRGPIVDRRPVGYIQAHGSAGETSLERQLAGIRHFAACEGLDLAATYRDEGGEGPMDRPGLASLMAAARQREFSTVVVEDLDRLHRDAGALAATLFELESLGVEVHTTRHDRIATVLDGHLAGEARRRLIERCRAGKRAAAARRSASRAEGTSDVPPVTGEAPSALVARTGRRRRA